MIEYTFVWPHSGHNIVVTGSFDNWTQSITLQPSPKGHSHTVTIPVEKTLFKFVVDGEWKVDESFATETDEHGNVNNVLTVAVLEKFEGDIVEMTQDIPGAFPHDDHHDAPVVAASSNAPISKEVKPEHDLSPSHLPADAEATLSNTLETKREAVSGGGFLPAAAVAAVPAASTTSQKEVITHDLQPSSLDPAAAKKLESAVEQKFEAVESGELEPIAGINRDADAADASDAPISKSRDAPDAATFAASDAPAAADASDAPTSRSAVASVPIIAAAAATAPVAAVAASSDAAADAPAAAPAAAAPVSKSAASNAPDAAIPAAASDAPAASSNAPVVSSDDPISTIPAPASPVNRHAIPVASYGMPEASAAASDAPAAASNDAADASELRSNAPNAAYASIPAAAAAAAAAMHDLQPSALDPSAEATLDQTISTKYSAVASGAISPVDSTGQSRAVPSTPTRGRHDSEYDHVTELRDEAYSVKSRDSNTPRAREQAAQQSRVPPSPGIGTGFDEVKPKKKDVNFDENVSRFHENETAPPSPTPMSPMLASLAQREGLPLEGEASSAASAASPAASVAGVIPSGAPAAASGASAAASLAPSAAASNAPGTPSSTALNLNVPVGGNAAKHAADASNASAASSNAPNAAANASDASAAPVASAPASAPAVVAAPASASAHASSIASAPATAADVTITAGATSKKDKRRSIFRKIKDKMF